MPKVIIYCEYLKFWNGIFFQNSEMGFLTSYFNQMKALKIQNIDFTEDLKSTADIFQANTQGLRTIWLIKRFKKRGVKIIVYAHATAEELSGGFRVFHFFIPLYMRYLSYIYNLADVVLCPSAYTERLLQEKYAVPKEKTVFISNGVDVGKIIFDPAKRRKFRTNNDIANSDIFVINVAMAIKKKGINTFVFLAKACPKIKFFWFGKIFKKFLAEKLPAHSDNLIFYGYIPDKLDAYSAADIFLFPSYEENQGISILEASAMGLPILVRDIPVYYQWMEDGINCLKAKSDKEFEEKIIQLADNIDLRQRLGKEAQRMVKENHSLETVGLKLESVYYNLLAVK